MSQRIRARADGLARRRRRFPLYRFLLVVVLIAAVAWLWHHPQQRHRLFAFGQDAVQRLADLTPSRPDTPSPAEPALAPLPDLPEAEQSSADASPDTADADTDTAKNAEEENTAEPQHPMEPEPEADGEATTAAPALPALDESDTAIASAASAARVGPVAGSPWMRNERFIRRFVATVDNLPRERASAALWPVYPTAPRFTVEGSESDAHIAAANHLRYAAAVQMVQNLDVAETVRQYRHYYPLFQQAYEELGYPGRYFNDRLVAVIDHLLQAPEPVAPRVNLMPVRSDVPQQQPWVRYQFEDPRLEALSAGQKVLVRMGPQNARAVKAKLRELRAGITRPASPAPASSAAPQAQ